MRHEEERGGGSHDDDQIPQTEEATQGKQRRARAVRDEIGKRRER